MWPQGEYPLIPVGKIVLNQNPANYFAEVEQIGFSPSHMIPGIEPSPDKMLHVSNTKMYFTLFSEYIGFVLCNKTIYTCVLYFIFILFLSLIHKWNNGTP